MKTALAIALATLLLPVSSQVQVMEASPAPKPSVKPAPTLKTPKVTTKVVMSKNLVNVKAQTSAKKATTFLLQRHNGKNGLQLKLLRVIQRVL